MRSSSGGSTVATARGKKKDDLTPNQDAVASVHGVFGRIIAVSDGLGSRSLSHHGANAAVRAAVKAVRTWSAFPAAPRDLHLLIEAYWRLLVSPQDPAQCAANLALVYVTPKGQVTVAGLGDTTVIIHHADGAKVLSGHEEHHYANETVALGVPHKLSAWYSLQCEGPVMALAATDGVIGDLDEAKLPGLPEVLCGHVRAVRPQQRSRLLRQSLSDLRGVDDKTLALIWS